MLGPSAEDQRKKLSLPHTGGHPFPLIHQALSFFFFKLGGFFKVNGQRENCNHMRTREIFTEGMSR